MNNRFDLTGRVAFITGAAGYLGQKMACGLAEAGAKVYINGRSEEKLVGLSERLKSVGLNVIPAPFDITNEDEIEAFFSTFEEGALDVIVNNAYSGQAGTVETALAQSYRDSYDVVMVAAQNITQRALPLLRVARKKNGDASIINVASMYGMVSPDISIYSSKNAANPPFYGAAKAALIQWSKYAACEFAKEGVRVNSISPGPFPSEEVQKTNSVLVQKIVNKVPMERLGQPDELIGPLLFLASSASSYVTGANIPVDGGWTAW